MELGFRIPDSLTSIPDSGFRIPKPGIPKISRIPESGFPGLKKIFMPLIFLVFFLLFFS